MIVVADNSGRLCNRLLLFAHACASAIESGQKFVHLIASDVIQFAKLDEDILKSFGVYCYSGNSVLKFVLRCRQAFYERVKPFDVDKYKIGNENRVKMMGRHQLLPHMLWCWWYRDPIGLMKHRTNIRRILAPRDEYIRVPKECAEKVRDGVACLVGVHVRRGDYREFREGRHFFSDEEYAKFMEMTKSSLSKDCRFVMVSDEPLDGCFFKHMGLDVFVFCGKDFREDLVMLSYCDYILGPESTFSWWAAYYGGKKLCHLHDRSDVINKDSFHEVTGFEI